MTETANSATRASSKATKGLPLQRLWSTEGIHPYDQVTWERRDVVQTNWKTGEVVFEQRGVEFPESWSVNASTIVTTKYFRGAVGTEQREWSLRQLIDRVVLTYVKAGKEYGYFATPDDADIFEAELTYMLLHQIFAFNSPVWFNVGTTSPQQVSACFILSVDDTMDSILNWYREEGLIFKGGSGAGLNLSRIRSSKELLSSGGTASGPVSFMRGADASAGTIKSGGATRRAAKMVVLDIDHPDIEEFVETKVREEDKIRALKAAGFDMDLGGADIHSVQYQNANNSVRVSDEFMRAVEEGTEFGLRARGNGEVIDTVDARALFRKVSEAAWACADPGIQYDDTINDWHTNPETGRINASNPCSEYMSLDNSSCNLASLNLMKFLKADDTFDSVKFAKSVEYITTAMDISICFADFPTEPIAVTTRDYRQLGIGYANLGALLMATGLPYDSEGGRALAAAITSLMTGTSYKRSAELAGVVGPYAGYKRNAAAHARVMRKHAAATDSLRTVTSLDGDVAKEAADMILTDDNFASIVNAVEEGRGVYNNIRKFATYILNSNVPEAVPFIVFLFAKGQIPLPLTVMQILAVDLGTDMIPAIALGVELPEEGVMQRPPRSQQEHLLNRPLLIRAFLFYGIMESAIAMSAFFFLYWQNGWPGIPMADSGEIYRMATTMTLGAIVVTQIGIVFNCRTERASVFKVGLFSNHMILIGIVCELTVFSILIYTPFLHEIFNTAPIGLIEWAYLFMWVPVVIFIDELRKAFLRNWDKRRFDRKHNKIEIEKGDS